MAAGIRADKPKALDDSNIRSRMEMQRADRDYFTGNYHQLLRKYPNQWVVISGGKLIVSESVPGRLLETLGKTRREDVFVYYLADPEDAMIL
jgi:hypothetical protein